MATYTLYVRYLVAAAVAVISAACAPIPVGTPLNSSATASTPALAVGDSWTYRVRDAYTSIERGTERFTVDRTSGGNVVLSVAPANGGEQTQVYDNQWNWLKRPATNLQEFSYNPPYPAFNFPLAPGKTWQTRLNATDSADGKSYPVRVDGTVVGWERVKVPAGEFDTLKIRPTRSVLEERPRASSRARRTSASRSASGGTSAISAAARSSAETIVPP